MHSRNAPKSCGTLNRSFWSPSHPMVRKGGEKLKGIAAMIESKIEYAIASHSKDPSSAVEALDACLEKNKGVRAKIL